MARMSWYDCTLGRSSQFRGQGFYDPYERRLRASARLETGDMRCVEVPPAMEGQRFPTGRGDGGTQTDAVQAKGWTVLAGVCVCASTGGVRAKPAFAPGAAPAI